MIRRRSLRTRAIKMLVLDEADEMLNKGKIFVSLLLPFSAPLCDSVVSQLAVPLLEIIVFVKARPLYSL